jgi:DNA-binding MarR family transcriptional regulator
MQHVVSLIMGDTKTHPLSLQDRDRLMGMLQALDTFSNLDKDMPLQMIRTMLCICIDEGIGPHELGRRMGVAGAVTSRHVSDLGEYNRYKAEGYNLIEQRMDVQDRRFRKAYLTPDGVTFRRTLLRALSCGCSPPSQDAHHGPY